ncbi:MAG: glutathione S-transferase N-terminal domain-containing protein [Gammaproteobacteria bacterium]|nr:glutathione S-transferase N-terminal domain-containing protein [Gammaproteobacteria bacterium]
MIKLYRHELSGHSHRVELFLNLLNLDFERIDVDLMAGEHKGEDFLRLNPFGQVPVLVDGDVVIGDSNAILVYLAEAYDAGGDWYPRVPTVRADIQRWLSAAAGSIAAGPGAARLVTVFGASIDHERAKTIANDLLTTVDGVLAERGFLAGASPTIADLAGYAYIAHAPEGEVSLAPYPNVRAWLARIEALDGFVGMVRSPVGLAA